MKSAYIGKTLTLFLALSAIAFTSCKKDKNPTPVEITKKITRIEENGSTSATFEYNTDGSLKKVNTSMLGASVVFTFSYDGQKRVSEVVSSEDSRVKYFYENNQLKRTENYEDGEKVSENSFTYEGGKVKSNTLFWGYPHNDGSGNITYRPVYRTIYHYYPNGSLQRISVYELNQATKELELDHEYVYQQYDTKKNPLAVISDFSQVLLHQPIHTNNPLIEKLYDVTGEVMETTTNQYTYDSAGYPVTGKSTVQPRGGSETVINIKFFY